MTDGLLYTGSKNWEQQSRNDNSILCKAVWLIYRDKEQSQKKRNFIEWKKTTTFLAVVLTIAAMKERQSSLQEKVNPSILNDDISWITDPSIFTSIALELLDQLNGTIWVFSRLKTTSQFLPQYTVSHRSDSSSEIICLIITLRVENSIIS